MCFPFGDTTTTIGTGRQDYFLKFCTISPLGRFVVWEMIACLLESKNENLTTEDPKQRKKHKFVLATIVFLCVQTMNSWTNCRRECCVLCDLFCFVRFLVGVLSVVAACGRVRAGLEAETLSLHRNLHERTKRFGPKTTKPLTKVAISNCYDIMCTSDVHAMSLNKDRLFILKE